MMVPPLQPALNTIEVSQSLEQPTHDVILKWIKNIKVYKSSGLPLIASRIWKLLFLHQSSLLFELVETIFNNFASPKSWKFATVVPLPKV